MAGNKIWVDQGCKGKFRYCYARETVTKMAEVQCPSFGSRYKECHVPRGRGITQISLKRQMSRTNCKKPKDKYGVIGANTVWVNKGCGGVFRYRYRTVRKMERCAYIYCLSQKKTYTACGVPRNRLLTKVSLIKQESRTSCNVPKKFGMAMNMIWVDKGCRGKFSYCYTSGIVPKFGEIRCYSLGDRYKECHVPKERKITQIALKQQTPRTNCKIPNDKYGLIRHDTIWVDKGCRAVFRYSYTTVPARKDDLVLPVQVIV